MDDRKNWAGNITYSAQRFHTPTTIEQAQEIVRTCRKVRALGSRHSFNTIADSKEDLLSLASLDTSVELDRMELDSERHTVTVGGSVRYGDLCRELDRRGYALHNLASLPHISVAGACATATHGSGDRNGNLATAVSALEMIAADGEIVRLSRERDGERFCGAVVGLGAVGMVTRITLNVVPTFRVRQDLYLDLPLTAVEEHFDAITSSAYSVSLFTDWTALRFNQVWLKSCVIGDEVAEAQPEFYGAMRATHSLHPIACIPADNCTEQMGVPGPCYDRLPHFRMDYTPSNGDELQTEYLVPRRHALAALRAVSELRSQIAPLLQISEIRTIAADDLWLSPCYGQACVGIHFTWQPNWPAVQALLPWIEAQLVPYEARPHWGKLFTLAPSQLRSLYPKLPEFQQLAATYDPHGKFRNDFVDAIILDTRF